MSSCKCDKRISMTGSDGLISIAREPANALTSRRFNDSLLYFRFCGIRIAKPVEHNASGRNGELIPIESEGAAFGHNSAIDQLSPAQLRNFDAELGIITMTGPH